MQLSEARIYVGTYAKYNSGSLKGEWIDLSDYTDAHDFYTYCAELHSDEEDPEYMFQDYENIPSSMVSEYHISGQFWELFELLQDADEDYQSSFMAWADNWGYNLSSDAWSAFDTFNNKSKIYQSDEIKAGYEYAELYYPEFCDHPMFDDEHCRREMKQNYTLFGEIWVADQ